MKKFYRKTSLDLDFDANSDGIRFPSKTDEIRGVIAGS